MEQRSQIKAQIDSCLTHMETRIVGQKNLIKKLFLALIAGGHVLVEGVPGIAKTLMIASLAQMIELPFKRIQFTPDLLPSDLIGMSVFRPDQGKFIIEKGPVFTNIILADEINRAPPKVQSALLEVMAEKQVTIFGQTFHIAPPFFVMATQNPIEQEGTYILPEAQLDRFMFKLLVTYPSQEEEQKIAQKSMVHMMPTPLEAQLTLSELQTMQQHVDTIHVEDNVMQYAVSLVLATRDPKQVPELEHVIQWGASPRATLWLIRGGRAHAMIEGRTFVTPHDIKALAKDILRHRIILSYEAQASGHTPDSVIENLLEMIPSP